VAVVALVLGFATPANAQTLPPNLPTTEQLANDNNLFIALAKKALQSAPRDLVSFFSRPPRGTS
jgi:metallo-beta-lactamase class B